MSNEIISKSSNVFFCKNCDYYTCRESQYERHLTTSKHEIRTNTNKYEVKKFQKVPNNRQYNCICGKIFKHASSLWNHKKKCRTTHNTEIGESIDDNHNISHKDDMIMMLIKENSDFKTMMMEQQTMMMEVIKNGTHNTTNSHNKSFNLQFFLNETCKDAMNITDFVESIQLQLSDLESLGELGYVDGISNIIIKNLLDLDITKRPVHCTDRKREIMYVKEEGKWEKDHSQQSMHKMVRKVADKNSRLIPKFKAAHPDCIKSTSKYNDQYTKLVIEALGGLGGDDFVKEEKIIRKITKVITVDKDM